MALNDEKTFERLVLVLETFTRGGASHEELEYTAELLIATAEDGVRDTELIETAQLQTLAVKLAHLLHQNKNDDTKDNRIDHAAERRRLRNERLETHFAIGNSCLAVLEEDEAWHPARIIRHIGEAGVCNDESVDCEERLIELEVEFIEFGKKQLVCENEVVLAEDVADREDAEKRTGLCEMCARQMNLTAHHVIPRVTHAKYLRKGYSKGYLNTCIMICRQCHCKIHVIEDNKTLAREYNTLDKLMQHPKIIAWVKYARKQKARIEPRKKNRWHVGK